MGVVDVLVFGCIDLVVVLVVYWYCVRFFHVLNKLQFILLWSFSRASRRNSFLDAFEPAWGWKNDRVCPRATRVKIRL